MQIRQGFCINVSYQAYYLVIILKFIVVILLIEAEWHLYLLVN